MNAVPFVAGGGGTAGGVLTIDNESCSLWTCNFNPFNLSDIGYSFGPVYEPLVFVNTLQSAKAYYAARSGIEWGAYEALNNGCAAANNPGLMPGGTLAGFTVNVTCADPNPAGYYYESQLNPPTYHVYVITATAHTTIAFGSPGYASRRIRVTITNAQ